MFNDEKIKNVDLEYTQTSDLPMFVFINGAGTGPWMWKYQTEIRELTLRENFE